MPDWIAVSWIDSTLFWSEVKWGHFAIFLINTGIKTPKNTAVLHKSSNCFLFWFGFVWFFFSTIVFCRIFLRWLFCHWLGVYKFQWFYLEKGLHVQINAAELVSHKLLNSKDLQESSWITWPVTVWMFFSHAYLTVLEYLVTAPATPFLEILFDWQNFDRSLKHRALLPAFTLVFSAAVNSELLHRSSFPWFQGFGRNLVIRTVSLELWLHCRK